MEKDFEKVQIQENSHLEEKMNEISRYIRGYQFTNKRQILGIPLVSILAAGEGSCCKKGGSRLENIAIGFLSLGAVSVGILSFGALAAGLIAIGAMAIGGFALGALAIGILAIGSGVFGIYAGGVAAFGKEISVGVVHSEDCNWQKQRRNNIVVVGRCTFGRSDWSFLRSKSSKFVAASALFFCIPWTIY